MHISIWFIWFWALKKIGILLSAHSLSTKSSCDEVLKIACMIEMIGSCLHFVVGSSYIDKLYSLMLFSAFVSGYWYHLIDWKWCNALECLQYDLVVMPSQAVPKFCLVLSNSQEIWLYHIVLLSREICSKWIHWFSLITEFLSFFLKRYFSVALVDLVDSLYLHFYYSLADTYFWHAF